MISKKYFQSQTIGSRLLKWFLLLALVPLISVSWFFYTISEKSLTNEIRRGLLAVANSKVHQIESMALEMKKGVSFLAKSGDTLTDLEIIAEVFHKYGPGSPEFGEVEKKILPDLEFFRDNYGFYDLLLITASGDIVFTIRKEADFGTNLYDGPFRETELADVFSQLKSSNAIRISDYRNYTFSSKPSLFIAAPVFSGGKFAGAVILQADPTVFSKVITDYTGLGETGETLIGNRIGQEAVFLFPLRHDPEAAFNRRIQMGSDKALPIQDAVQGNSGDGQSVDYRREKIEAVWRYIPAFRWGLVAKIDTAEAFSTIIRQRKMILFLVGFTGLLVITAAILISRSLAEPLTRMAEIAAHIAKGDLGHSIEGTYEGEIGVLAEAFQKMISNLRKITAENERQIWMSDGQSRLNDNLRGEQDIPELSENVLRFLCEYLDAQVGTLSVLEEDILHMTGTYAHVRRKNVKNRFRAGEGLIGQSALEKKTILVTQVPEDYISVHSSLGASAPVNLLVTPFLHEGEVVGVIEIGAVTAFSQAHLDFVGLAADNIAIAFHMARDRSRMKELLDKSRLQTEELQQREESLQAANEELVSQTEALKKSETRLKEKQSELENANTELQAQTANLEVSKNALEEKQAAVERKNTELKMAQDRLKVKAEELALTSRYKSDFLANMSHELRTPLNSLLLLSRTLMDNREGNLNEDQLESVRIIHRGGHELLELINEILDLSKIEAGKMVFQTESVRLSELQSSMTEVFQPLSREKGVEFTTRIREDLPASILTDRTRVAQILKNLLSNAFKFTDRGKISMDFFRPPQTIDLSRSGLEPKKTVGVSVSDTGIGMTEEQQKIVFEAFQQGDGGTSRKYGGTGLGLSISRELAVRLGGEMSLSSTQGKGSTFTLYLPEKREADAPGPTPVSPSPDETESEAGTAPSVQMKTKRETEREFTAPEFFPDDRNRIEPCDRILLVIEDDVNFARVLYNSAHEKQFKCLVAGSGRIGLELAREYRPAAVTLDLKLPDMNGWDILGSLKEDPNTRHIPVHIISVEAETLDAYRRGAIGYLTKPVRPEDLNRSFLHIENFINSKIRTILIVEDDTDLRISIRKLLAGNDVRILEAETGKGAVDLLRSEKPDCMILDLNLPDFSGFDLLNKVNQEEEIARCPVIIYTGRALSEAENEKLMQYADSIIIKGAKSPERLLDETALFLHRVIAEMPEDKRGMIRQLYEKEALFTGKKILIVDDDMRNSFALSKLLGDKGAEVQIAGDGRKALELLEKNPETDLVLMDIMMPVMDGYEAIGRIREDQRFRRMPILALTAKAMVGDREKCLAAGANDYLTKPVDPDRLFSLLRVWLYQHDYPGKYA